MLPIWTHSSVSEITFVTKSNCWLETDWFQLLFSNITIPRVISKWMVQETEAAWCLDSMWFCLYSVGSVRPTEIYVCGWKWGVSDRWRGLNYSKEVVQQNLHFSSYKSFQCLRRGRILIYNICWRFILLRQINCSSYKRGIQDKKWLSPTHTVTNSVAVAFRV
jgi:hypothetical protein